MKLLSYIALLAFLTFCTGYSLSHWWLVAFIGFVVALLFKEGILKSGLITLMVVALVWFGYAYSIDIANESILSTRIGNLFGGLGPFALAALSGLVGGLVAMFGAFTGASLQSVIGK